LTGGSENQITDQFHTQPESMISLPEPNFPEGSDPLQYQEEVTSESYSGSAVVNDPGGNGLLFGDFDADSGVSVDSVVPLAVVPRAVITKSEPAVQSDGVPGIATSDPEPGESRFRDGAIRNSELGVMPDTAATNTGETDVNQQPAIISQAGQDQSPAPDKASKTQGTTKKSVEVSQPAEPGDSPGDSKIAAAIQPRPASSTVEAPSTPSPNEIIFEVDKESWIDVRDNDGERLIYRTVNRGQRLTLVGKPPFSVFIGSAEGVRVEYQGNTIPFTVHESGLFARFSVGPE
jgi:hypothetical protein